MRLSRIWRNAQPFHVEFAEVSLEDNALSASGVAIGAEPVAYRLEYELNTTHGYVTTRLAVSTQGAGWRRTLLLERSGSGQWSCTTEAHGDPDTNEAGLTLPSPGGDMAALVGALDCDLGLSPLTNTMPLLRHQLHRPPASSIELLMAWVAVPELAVYPSKQRYTYLRPTPEGALVRFESLDSDFTADITFDEHGLVVDYPGIGQALHGREGAH